ncbi:hypothetical protein Ancab_014973 [Ancistrocladus abbreviatus]
MLKGRDLLSQWFMLVRTRSKRGCWSGKTNMDQALEDLATVTRSSRKMQMLLRKNMRDVDKNVNNLNRETMGHAADNPVKTSNDNDVALFQEEDCTREKEVGPTSSPNRIDEEITKMGGGARNEPNKYPMEGLEYGLDTREACEEGWRHNKQTKLQCSTSKERKCGSDFEHQPEQPSELKWEKLKRTKLQKQQQIALEGKRWLLTQ